MGETARDLNRNTVALARRKFGGRELLGADWQIVPSVLWLRLAGLAITVAGLAFAFGWLR